MNKILLFYKYISIENPEEIVKWQREICQSLDLKGRILIAHEGINGTIGGLPENISHYIETMKNHSLFFDIDFKQSYATEECFPKLKVKLRPEIVRLGIDSNIIQAKNGGKHLTPEETHKLIEQKSQDLVILDARNAFEAKVGKFVDAIIPQIDYFRELPQFIDSNLDLFKDKKVVMYCTGGIRCERASAYLKSKNVAKEVYQMYGGIHNYTQDYPDGFFRGKNYVFDGRISIKVNEDIIGSCESCNIPCDDFINCISVVCNKHCILCINCRSALKETCSKACYLLVSSNKVMTRKIPAKTADSIESPL